MTEIVGAKLQGTLGRMETFNRDDMAMEGLMSLARVIKVHHFSGTADVQLVNTNDIITSGDDKKGRFSARIMSRNSFFDEKTKRYWGTLDPIAEGSIVLVTFLDGLKKRPIIIGAFHRPDNEENINSAIYPIKEKQAGLHRREALKQLQVYPNMTYFKIDGEGNMERTFGNKSFFAIYNTKGDPVDIVSDKHGSMDFEDLTEKDKREEKEGRTIEADWEEAKAPLKLLFVHQDKAEKGKTKIFMSEEGTFRITRDEMNGKISFLEVGTDGSIKVRRQLDSPYFGEGSDYADIKIEPTGEIILSRNKMDNKVTLTMTEQDLNVKVIGSGGTTTTNLTSNSINYRTTGNVTIEAGGTVTIKGSSINLN